MLVVDDNVDAAAGLGSCCRSSGTRWRWRTTARPPSPPRPPRPPDLVLLDIGLPGMDGYAVAARLRAAGHTRAALVALTGYGREDDVRRSRDAGFDHHLVKPVDLAQLGKIIAALGAASAPPFTPSSAPPGL